MEDSNLQLEDTKLIGALGRTIRSCRESLDLSQDDFASQIKLSPRSVKRIEAGAEAPRLHVLVACADAVGISVSDLWELARLEEEANWPLLRI